MKIRNGRKKLEKVRARSPDSQYALISMSFGTTGVYKHASKSGKHVQAASKSSDKFMERLLQPKVS